MALRYQLQLMGRLRSVLPACGAFVTTLNQPVHHQPVLHNAQRQPLIISYCCYAKGANRPKHSAKETKPKITLNDDELAEVVRIQNFRSEMQKVVHRLQESFIKHLSLNSAAGSIDTIPVHVDGQEYSLAEVAQIAKKNPQLIVLHMASFPDAIKATIQAIQTSGLNISTQQDGTTVFCHLPKITREHRESLAKNAKTLFNKAKEDLLSVERKYIKEIQKNKQNVSEDLSYNATLQVKMEVENTINKADAMTKAKQQDLLGGK
ncbi:ribosome-recycling factor, mitochondrial [Dermacentor andersoni]|uniref:ribosome-recycling factor, mitochondrial n=1 Tax=Dermacentor andersoni TaxID=34620 RepID=UPI0021552266|nr:ribosome-recycling factor, mitochondrial-like [Dermacentor andersoni]XP_050051246.1 ribosome-recycling factor, mitochondrial-like [Dermacentor andersoni]XP_054918918.1 ribosome-recycling factor, mitochondrial-like [Dermacentor andersoni]XP_054918919.1 ribosome-recycling factor, mitochondrial-like [Dermacentor andersoni]XP_054918920.1 ribosome-recycling factor, mitochondrial-like [Dermacentor andersoni]